MDKGWMVMDEEKYGVAVARHVLPYTAAPVHATREGAEAYALQANLAEVPSAMDPEGLLLLCAWGHKLSSDCDCRPEIRETEFGLPMIVHKHHS